MNRRAVWFKLIELLLFTRPKRNHIEQPICIYDKTQLLMNTN